MQRVCIYRKSSKNATDVRKRSSQHSQFTSKIEASIFGRMMQKITLLNASGREKISNSIRKRIKMKKLKQKNVSRQKEITAFGGCSWSFDQSTEFAFKQKKVKNTKKTRTHRNGFNSFLSLSLLWATIRYGKSDFCVSVFVCVFSFYVVNSERKNEWCRKDS